MKKNESERLSDEMKLKRRLILNAMDDPGDLDTGLTAADEPIVTGAEDLNKQSPPGLKEP